MASPTLTARIQSFANKLTGTSVVDNAANPNSAYSKMKGSIQTPAQQKANASYSSLPSKQQVIGVPGVSKTSQLPKQFQNMK